MITPHTKAQFRHAELILSDTNWLSNWTVSKVKKVLEISAGLFGGFMDCFVMTMVTCSPKTASGLDQLISHNFMHILIQVLQLAACYKLTLSLS